MKLVNESGQPVSYWIQSSTNTDCGDIAVGGLADLPAYDNQTNVYVGFNTVGGVRPFAITCADTGVGEQVEMALVAE